MPGIAFFDIDGTLIVPSTGFLVARGLRAQGLLRRRDVVRGAWYTLLMRTGGLEYESVARDALRVMEGRKVREVRGWFQRAFETHLRRAFVAEVVGRLVAHHAAGDRVVLLSATSRLVGDLIAERLPVDEVICASTEVEHGRITGRLVLPVPYREGKVPWAERYAAKQGLGLADSVFYSDSASDLPLLERVGRPVVVRPDPRLRRVARRRGWEILHGRRICGLEDLG